MEKRSEGRGVKEGMEKKEVRRERTRRGGVKRKVSQEERRVPPSHSPSCLGLPHTPVEIQDIWHACQWDEGSGREPTVHCCPSLKSEDEREIITQLLTHLMLLKCATLKFHSRHNGQLEWNLGTRLKPI